MKADDDLVRPCNRKPATGVLSNAKEICAAVKRVSPDTLTVLDGVCSVGSEEIRMDDWGVDVVSLPSPLEAAPERH